MMKTLVVTAAALTTLGLGTAMAQDVPDMNPMAGAPSAGMPAEGRPVPRSIGIGLGTAIGGGSDIWQPNVASVRFVLSPSLMIEPEVMLQFGKTTVDPPGLTPSTSTSQTTLGAGARGRMLLASRGPVDLNLLGRVMFSHVSNDEAQDTDQQNLSLGWGVGLTWFFNQWWGLSLDALNPFISYTRQAEEFGNTRSNWQVGVVFDPSVIVMIHAFL